METKYNSHIHRYGLSIFGKIVVNISKSNINENKISDRETPVELLSLEPQYGTVPLLFY